MNDIFFPAEWYPQSAIQLTWPHTQSDWGYMIEDVTACFKNIAREIMKRQKLVIVCPDAESLRNELIEYSPYFHNLILAELPSNDTWARDHGGISILHGNEKTVCDFTFNGWGLKFAADQDNQITTRLFREGIFKPGVKQLNRKNFVLEGGSVESDGKGTILTTSECLLSPNRNAYLTREEIEVYLKANFGSQRILWLDDGYLAGDDTDSHIDTLARFCNEHTIAYIECNDENDEHYEALKKMEKQLRSFADYEGKPYRLIPLPMAAPAYDENNERLPATYANFLIMNEAVLVPFYNNPETDKLAQRQLQTAFPSKEIVGIDCSALICQHGSLHCVTMQYPQGFI